MIHSVLIADDHQLVRKGLQMVVREVLGFHTHIDFAGTGKEVVEKLNNGEFTMLLTDLNMPDTDEFGIVSQARTLWPKLRIIVITVKPDRVFAARFFKEGVMAYVNKTESDAVLSEAIATVARGKRYISRAQAELFASALIENQADNPFDKLSRREFEVVLLLLKGYGAIEVANALSISPSTASSFRGRIFEKLSIKNLLELNHLAQLHQIAPD